MADSRYVIVYRSGLALDAWTAQLWDKLKRKFPNLILTQGVHSGAAASGGTHLGLGVLDLYLGGHDWKAVLKYAFEIGFFGWYRPTIPGVWKTHIHLGVRNHPQMAASLKAQQVSWTNKRNGLVGNGADFYTWRPANYKSTAPYGTPTTVKIMGFNLPAPGVGIGADLGNDHARALAAAKQVRANSPHFVAWNELGPVKTAGLGEKPSIAGAFAHDVDAALGRNFALLKPTRSYNENHLSYRSDRWDLVEQYDDSILEAKYGSGNKHLTRGVFKHAKGLTVAIGVMHLPPGKSTSNAKDREIQAADALASIKAVSAKHDDCPYILIGDVNTNKDLAALASKGMKRARRYADKSAGPVSTYTNYAKTSPSTDVSQELDSTYWSSGWYVLTWSVIRDLAKGKYRKPRPSDHDATVSTARI
jgi:hypothetical protein